MKQTKKYRDRVKMGVNDPSLSDLIKLLCITAHDEGMMPMAHSAWRKILSLVKRRKNMWHITPKCVRKLRLLRSGVEPIEMSDAFFEFRKHSLIEHLFPSGRDYVDECTIRMWRMALGQQLVRWYPFLTKTRSTMRRVWLKSSQ